MNRIDKLVEDIEGKQLKAKAFFIRVLFVGAAIRRCDPDLG